MELYDDPHRQHCFSVVFQGPPGRTIYLAAESQVCHFSWYLLSNFLLPFSLSSNIHTRLIWSLVEFRQIPLRNTSLKTNEVQKSVQLVIQPLKCIADYLLINLSPWKSWTESANLVPYSSFRQYKSEHIDKWFWEVLICPSYFNDFSQHFSLLPIWMFSHALPINQQNFSQMKVMLVWSQFSIIIIVRSHFIY